MNSEGLTGNNHPVSETVNRGAVLDVIGGRRSIRYGYSERPIPDEVIRDIVRCGLSAPSSKNAQPWRLHVVRSSSALKELAEAVQNAKEASTYVPVDPETGKPRPDWPSTVAESAEVLRQVPLGIFVENRGEFSH